MLPAVQKHCQNQYQAAIDFVSHPQNICPWQSFIKPYIYADNFLVCPSPQRMGGFDQLLKRLLPI